MTDCLENKKLIEKDSDYLVEKVKYKGTVYGTVIQWSEAMAKGTMPYLHGVYASILIEDKTNYPTLVSIITTHGGTIVVDPKVLSNLNQGSHPYLHSNLGSFFIIHDGRPDLRQFKNDTNNLFTLFTEQEFVHFMLKREICKDKRPNPIPLTTDADD